MWDVEVDVACIGAGIGALASAIVTVDAGGEVLVADAAPTHVGSPTPGALRERIHAKRGWLAQSTLDAETEAYFAALIEDVSERADVAVHAPVPVRVARNLSREEAHGHVVEPFVGSRLTHWASQCIASPYGLMYSSMRDSRTTTMRSSDGDSIEVFPVGPMEWRAGYGESALRQWVTAQADQRDIETQTASALHRLVFEDGVIVGVVLSTPEGPHAVRTRAGVMFAPRGQDPSVEGLSDHTSGDRLQVCLVGRTASRFGRVELLTTEPSAPPRPTCAGSRNQFREGMHDTRQPALEGWRCGKVRGHPPLGQ